VQDRLHRNVFHLGMKQGPHDFYSF
jgi:hypothetical protein